MELCLIRHALAEERGFERDDATRALTVAGRKRFARAVRGLAALDQRFDRVFYSPLLRAQETADLLEPVCDGEFEVTSLLAREPTEDLLSLVALSGVERVALVGHDPHLCHLLTWLVFDRRDLPSMQIVLKKGGVAVLAGEPRPGGMLLCALYPPSTLRAIARR